MTIAKKFLDMNFINGKYKDMLFEEEYKEGLPKEERIILYYLYTNERCNMGELATIFGLANSTTNFVVKKLIKKNFVIVTPLPTDNRVRIVNISEVGKEQMERMIAFIQGSLTRFYTMVHDEVYKQTISEFLPEEVKTLDKFYEKAMKELKSGLVQSQNK